MPLLINEGLARVPVAGPAPVRGPARAGPDRAPAQACAGLGHKMRTTLFAYLLRDDLNLPPVEDFRVLAALRAAELRLLLVLPRLLLDLPRELLDLLRLLLLDLPVLPRELVDLPRVLLLDLRVLPRELLDLPADSRLMLPPALDAPFLPAADSFR